MTQNNEQPSPLLVSDSDDDSAIEKKGSTMKDDISFLLKSLAKMRTSPLRDEESVKQNYLSARADGSSMLKVKSQNHGAERGADQFPTMKDIDPLL